MLDLSSIPLDVEEVLEELRLHWQDHPDAAYNPLALTKVKNLGTNVMFCCPYHAQTGSPSCGMMTEYPYGFQCFGCEVTGNLAQLAAHVLDLPGEFQGMQFLLREFLSTAADERPPLDIDALIDGTDASKRRSLPDSEATKYTAYSHPYMASRGFSPRTLAKYEIGYDKERNAITIPVRTSKGLLRFVKRRLIDRKMFLNEKDIYKKDIIYGLYYILQAPRRITEIDINESETDTMSCYQGGRPAGATMGKIISEEQVKELMQAGIKTVNLFFDNDIYGVLATLRSFNTISKMSAIRVNVVLYPGGHWGIDTVNEDELLYKDANNLLKAGLLKQVTVVPFDTFVLMQTQNEKSITEILGRKKNDREQRAGNGTG